MKTTIDVEELRLLREGYRKIVAFASSAGVTITNRDALAVIKDIAAELAAPTTRTGAIARHVERVRFILADHRE